jgi:prepilin-type N-terminal cleavage/methylation domain-containing protein
MLKIVKNKKGFTLIELVLVIAILGVLAVSALPSIFDISLTNAKTNARDAVVGAVQAALSLSAASQISNEQTPDWPTNLEPTDLADGTCASRTVRLFNSVLQNGVSTDWCKVDDDCYAYDSNGNGTFDDGTDEEYQYLEADGTFLGIANCGS